MKNLVKINLKLQGNSPSLASQSHKMALVETVKGCDCEISAEDQSASTGMSLLFMFHSLTLKVQSKLQALVYNTLPSTTAVFSYAIGSRKLSANEQFFCWSSNSSKFVTNNSNYIRHLFHN